MNLSKSVQNQDILIELLDIYTCIMKQIYLHLIKNMEEKKSSLPNDFMLGVDHKTIYRLVESKINSYEIRCLIAGIEDKYIVQRNRIAHNKFDGISDQEILKISTELLNLSTKLKDKGLSSIISVRSMRVLKFCVSAFNTI